LTEKKNETYTWKKKDYKKGEKREVGQGRGIEEVFCPQ